MRKPSYEVDVVAGTREHGLAPNNGGLPLVQCNPIGHRATTASAARRARAACARAAPPTHRQAAQWRTAALHAQTASRSRRRSCTWEHGLAPTKGGLSLVQCHFTCYGVTRAGAVRGARTRQARDLRLLPRDKQRDGAHALHAQTASRSGGRSWHVGARPCTEGGRSLAGAVPFHKA